MSDLFKARKAIEDIDIQMAALFEARMKCVEDIAAYKKKNGIPILDTGREKELAGRNEMHIKVEELKPYYRQFIRSVMDISKQYQLELMK